MIEIPKQPKPENKDSWITAAITPTMNIQLWAFAARNGVSKSEAVRFIIARFFEEHPEDVSALPQKNETDFNSVEVEYELT